MSTDGATECDRYVVCCRNLTNYIILEIQFYNWDANFLYEQLIEIFDICLNLLCRAIKLQGFLIVLNLLIAPKADTPVVRSEY